jgi:hypothetical protein
MLSTVFLLLSSVALYTRDVSVGQRRKEGEEERVVREMSA